MIFFFISRRCSNQISSRDNYLNNHLFFIELVFVNISLDFAHNSSIRSRMNIAREHQREAERGLLNLALIAAEDAALIAATPLPSDQTSSNHGENISMLRELGHRIAVLAEAVEILQERSE